MSRKMSPYPEPSQKTNQTTRIPAFRNIQMELPAIRWWYSIAAPKDDSTEISLTRREIVRRGRVASLILPVIIILLLLPIPTAMGNPILLSTLIFVFILDMLALFWLNRTGHVTAAGIVVVSGIELGVGTSILTYTGGFGPSNLPLFDLLVQSLVVAVAMLAPASVFLIAIINCIFLLFVLHSSIITPELAQIVATNLGSILPPAITLQVAVAWFIFVLLRSTTQAIARADRAEEFVTLIQQNLELQQRELERTQQIEQGIEQMLAAMARFANGDSTIRVPESQENILWKIGRSLNNLLARLKDYQHKTYELEQARKEIEVLNSRLKKSASIQNELQSTREAAAHLKETIRRAKSMRTPLALPPRSGTIIDEIAAELHTIQP